MSEYNAPIPLESLSQYGGIPSGSLEVEHQVRVHGQGLVAVLEFLGQRPQVSERLIEPLGWISLRDSPAINPTWGVCWKEGQEDE